MKSHSQSSSPDWQGIVVVLTIFIGLAIWPACVLLLTVVLGAVTRLRVDYRPTSIRLPDEEGGDGTATTHATTVFGMIAAAKRSQGWVGVFSGMAAPTSPLTWAGLISAALTSFAGYFIWHYTSVALEKLDKRHVSTLDSRSTVAAIITSVILIPAGVIMTREMLTPFPGTSEYPRALSATALLSSAERANPFRLWSWGTVVTVAVRSILYVVVIPLIKHALLGKWPMIGVNKPMWTVFWGIAFAFTVVLTPLDVLFARLGAQRFNPAGAYHDEVSDDAHMPDWAVVIRSPPYSGLADAVSSIVKEEGWTALYRGWVWTGLFAMIVPTVLSL
ncbi:uncharacterized protein LOC62_02G003350 [Vanrija pseudolonga]|uniref:Mitochondrial carrier n=1 Tax=Vanrija pseudolonga TaxID=143232 RepID=A0AAF0Y442_9TREE|nr:hypothetical protein LOC62_02G003350 [Vanrija pseudolonga]